MSYQIRAANFKIFILLCIATIFVVFISPSRAQEWQASVDETVLNEAVTGNETEFLVFLNEQADLRQAADFNTKIEKGRYVFEQLTTIANRSQKPLIDTLDAMAVEYQPFWITNMIWVRGDLSVLNTLAERSDVTHIYANPSIKLDTTPQDYQADYLIAQESGLWNINMVKAPEVWNLGFAGQGAVVGGQDTGYDWRHPALINQYRGWNGTDADHNYNWHDAIHDGIAACGPDSPEPCDGQSHGTHTMGTIVGDDGDGNQIGMAPGARWIGCRNMNDQGVGTPATYAECYQWFVAPTDLNGNNPNLSMAPHVINNSWSCPISEGCTFPDILKDVVENVRAAGIVTSHSAGNSGCSGINTPAAIYDASFTVGATTIDDEIWSGSSRGPVTVDGSNRLKPDISAPGRLIYSSIPGTGYGYKTGTSMASPHVAGLVALLISAESSLAGQPDELEDLIMRSAVPKEVVQGCDGLPDNQIPNNTYGYGRIDALRAVVGTFDHKLYYPLLFTALED